MACKNSLGHELLRRASTLMTIDRDNDPDEHQAVWECLTELIKRYMGAVVSAARCKNLSPDDIHMFAPRLIGRLPVSPLGMYGSSSDDSVIGPMIGGIIEDRQDTHDNPELLEDDDPLVFSPCKSGPKPIGTLDMLEMGWFWGNYMLEKDRLRKFAEHMENRYRKMALVDDEKKDRSLGSNLKGRAAWAVDDYLREKIVVDGEKVVVSSLDAGLDDSLLDRIMDNSPDALTAPDPMSYENSDWCTPPDLASESAVYFWLMKQQPEDRLAYWLTDMYEVWRLPDPDDLEWLAELNSLTRKQIESSLEDEYMTNKKSRVRHPLSAEFVGHLLGISPNTASQRASRIRRQVRTMFSSSQFEE